MVLTAVTSGGVQNNDPLGPGTTGFIEDLGLALNWGLNVDVFASEVIFIRLGLLVLDKRSVETLTDQFQKASGEMGELAVFVMVAIDTSTILNNVHSLRRKLALYSAGLTFLVSKKHIPECQRSW